MVASFHAYKLCVLRLPRVWHCNVYSCPYELFNCPAAPCISSQHTSRLSLDYTRTKDIHPAVAADSIWLNSRTNPNKKTMP